MLISCILGGSFASKTRLLLSVPTGQPDLNEKPPEKTFLQKYGLVMAMLAFNIFTKLFGSAAAEPPPRAGGAAAGGGGGGAGAARKKD